MTWGFIAAAGVAVVGGVMAANSKNGQIAQQADAQGQQEAASWQHNISDNQAIADANLMNTIRTGYKAGILNIQRAQAKQEAAAAQQQLGVSKQNLTSATNANSFAAGAVGSSVDAVMSDIQIKAAQAKDNIDASYIQQSANFDTQLNDLLHSGTDSIKSSEKSYITAASAPQYQSLGSSALGGLVQVGGNYLRSNMSLGLGTPATSTTAATGTNMGMGDILSDSNTRLV